MIYYGFSKIVNFLVLCGLVKCLVGIGVMVNVVLFGLIFIEGVVEMFCEDVQKVGQSIEEVGIVFVWQYCFSLIIQCLVMFEEVVNLVVYICLIQVLVIIGVVLWVDGGVFDSLV